MRYAKLVGLVIALALLVGVLPAAAQGGNPAVKDEGNNIYLVDGAKGPIPNLLPAEEVAKIHELVFSVPGGVHRILSPVSADDQTVLVQAPGPLFLNLSDGATVPLKAVVPGALPLSNYFWLDGDTIGHYVFDDQFNIYLITGDRHSGASKATSIDAAGGFPVFVSPDGRRALYATQPVVDGSTASAVSALVTLAQMFNPFDEITTNIITSFSSLYVRDSVTGATRVLANLTPGARVENAAFSQDGNLLALTVVEGYPATTRARYDGALLSELIYRDVTGNLPPAENPYFASNKLITLDFGSGQLQTLRAADGDGVVYTDVSWSTDNQTLLVKVDQPGRLAGRRYPQYLKQYRSGSSLRFYTRGLQEIRRLERIELSDIELEASFISPDEVIIQSQYRLDRRPWYYNLRSGELRDLATRAGTYRTVTPTNGSRRLLFSFSSVSEAPDFYSMNWDGSAIQRITWTNAALTARVNLKQQPVSFTLRDGTTHTGVLVLPGDAPFPPKNLPIIIYQEGGPTLAIPNWWSAKVESPFALLPRFGFGLLIVPLYGRYGIGPERFEAMADGTNFGQRDIDAQAEIVAQMRARGWASKVGIVGCSYGGYFTTQSITRHPTTYDAAHTQCSLIDLISEWSRGFNSLAPWMEGLPPQVALEEYRRDSPAYNADRVRTPLLAFHGTADFIPVTLMENFMLKVINNGVPAKLLKFQDAGHGLGNSPPQLVAPYEVYGAQEQLIWFRTYLMGR